MIAQCIHDFSTSYGLPVSLLLAGLVGGFTHCAGMCSPFVLAQVDSNTGIGRLKGSLLIPYHLGRMTTYVGMAVALSGAVNLAFLFSETRAFIAAPLLLLAALIFVVTAFPSLGRVFPWIVRIQMAAPFAFISNLTGQLLYNPGVFKRYLLGVLLGFMPCGLVIAAVMAASSAASPVYAGLSMAAFAMGTVPALVLVALGGEGIKHKYPQSTVFIKRGALMISGIWLMVLAGLMVF